MTFPPFLHAYRAMLPCAVLAAAASAFVGRADFVVTLREPSRTAVDLRDIADQYGLTVKHALAGHGVAAVRVPLGLSPETAEGLLASDSRIARVEPDYIVRLSELPDDSLFARQWALYNPGSRADIKAPEAWALHTGSRKTVVAILDTGFDFDHPDLAANLWHNTDEVPDNGRDDDRNGFIDDVRGWDFAGNTNRPVGRHYHGTLMAGIVGAVTGNGRGMAGVMHEVSLMAVKGLGDGGFGFTSDLIAGIYYAVDNGAHAINASWGGGGYQEAMREAIRYAAAHDVVFIAAAGNWRRDNDLVPFFPSSYPEGNIIAVAAGDREDSLATFSHYGAATVDLTAPGVEVLGTDIGGGYLTTGGTSVAAPHVAGCVGLLASYAPGLPYDRYVDFVLGAVEPLEQLEGLCTTGGRLDMYRALKAASVYRAGTRIAMYYLMRMREKEQEGER
jgi:subtilisin family serine protease